MLKLKFAENKSVENTTETQELSEKTEEISVEDKKVVQRMSEVLKASLTQQIFLI